MTEHTSTSARETIVDRLDRTVSALSPDVRSVAFDALEPVDRSFPVALCRASAAAVSSDRPSEQTIESITLVIETLQGYVRLRNDLLEHDRYTSATDRDAAILAGDYLHAFAHSSIGAISTDDACRLELFRVLTSGSNELARAYPTPVSDPTSDTDRTHDASTGPLTDTSSVSKPDAILAGVAAELGATAAGATETVRQSARAYGASLSRALTIAASGPEASSSESPHSVATRVLSSRLTGASTDGPVSSGSGGSLNGASDGVNHEQLLERELEYARTALETIETVTPDDSAAETAEPSERGQPIAGSSPPNEEQPEHKAGYTDRGGFPPRARLDRATRIPFEGVLVSDE